MEIEVPSGRRNRLSSAERITNATFWDQQARDRVSRIIAAPDLCLVLLRKLPLFTAVILSKIFEFMGAGPPILTTVVGESRGIVERAGAGVFPPPEDEEALASTLRALANDRGKLATKGRAGRAFVKQHYSRTALARRYLEILEDLVRRASSAAAGATP